MSTNGSANGHVNGGKDTLQWRVGLRNSVTEGGPEKSKYLTAESFGNKINASGQFLKKKQTWTLEFSQDERVYIRSHTNFYLSTDKYGNVSCNTEAHEREETEQFVVEYSKDGKWAFKNPRFGTYLGGIDDNVKCFAKNIGQEELWTVQLAIHPQVNLRNVNRKRYAVLCDEELQCKEIIPWGEAAFIVVQFIDSTGKYALKTCDNKFLHRDGTLVSELVEDAQFTLEIKFGGLAFKDRTGYYLTAVGSTAVMKSGKNKAVGKDELFSFEDSHPQVAVQSVDNEKYISTKQGQDLSANQTEIEEQEIFQMEFDKNQKKWYLRTCKNLYWSKASFDGVSARKFEGNPDDFKFEVSHVGDGTVTLAGPGGKYLFNKSTGSVYCKSTTIDENTPKCFFFKLRTVNRPFLILKCDYGFVGIKTSGTEVVCNKTTCDITYLEFQEDGTYCLKGSNGKYWTIGDQNIIFADGEGATTKFLVEFLSQSELCIKAPSGKYLKSGQNTFTAAGEEIDASTRWEY